MNHRLSSYITLALLAAFTASCTGGGLTLPQPAPTEAEGPALLTLPPAWTATPSQTVVPATATATATPHPNVLAARQTATLWPTLHVVAVGGGTDSSAWKRIEFETASFLVPPAFEVADMGGFDDVIVLFMEAFAGGLVEMMEGMVTPAPGEATPTPISLDELDSAFDFDFLMAADPGGEAAVFLVGEPLPQGFDLESMMTEAVGSVQGEVEVLGRELVGGAPRQTGRVFLRSRDLQSGETQDQVMYVIVEGDRAWTLLFQALDLQAMLPAFETSALSLVPTP